MTRAVPFAATLCLVAVTIHAQAPAAPSAVRCDEVLTAAEAKANAGDAYQGPVVDEPSPGFTRCEWQGEDGNFGFTFASLKYLADSELTADQQFEFTVQALESESQTRELVPGIGVRTAILPAGDDALLVAVQRADGVARMITYKLAREKALALARAIAEP